MDQSRAASRAPHPDAPADAAMLATANSLLAAIGADQNAITSLPQLRASASSLFVALFELFFAERLTHVRRADLSDEALAFNAQQVVDALRRRGDDLPRYVSGRAIAAGDLSALQFMLVYFAATLARAEALAADDADALRKGHGLGVAENAVSGELAVG